jgi:multidrug efflux pump subunit AcrA (membrane-fusion protein)
VVEALADVESARLALQEFESGTFLQEQQQKESDEFVAREDLRRAEEYLRYSERLAARGYVTEVQLEADRFAVEKARKGLESATTKLEVLNRFTKQKSLNKLKADVETAEARLASRQNSHNLDDEKLKQIETQIAKCVISAPTSGQVVYANETNRNAATGEPLIAEGKLVRERQLIIRLPDPKRMRVIARINESRIDRVKEGMRVNIKVDAFANMPLEGTVRDVSEYPMASLIPYSMMKEYAAQIDIHEPPEGLRAGMTAQAAIQVQSIDSAVQVPLQAVIQRDNRFFCLVTIDNERIEAREVTVGLSNEKSVVIEDGVFPGHQVVLAPQNYEDLISLPAASGKPRSKAIAKAKPGKVPGKNAPVAGTKAPGVAPARDKSIIPPGSPTLAKP